MAKNQETDAKKPVKNAENLATLVNVDENFRA